MNQASVGTVAVVQEGRKSALLSYASLFTSVGTLLCCALPSLLVLVGLGATVASVLSSMPWLVALSRHKVWTFSISGATIACSFIYTYAVAPRLQAQACSPDYPAACAAVSRLSKVVLWISACLYVVGCFTAFFLGPILARLDG